MPFKSQAQRGWMWANEPEMARRWQAHTPKGKKLPEHVTSKKETDMSSKEAVIATFTPEKVASLLAKLPAPFAAKLCEKVAADMQREKRAGYAKTLCDFIDQVCAELPLEKAASLRVVQAGVSRGDTLDCAIKEAFPQASGTRRGIIASGLVRQALSWEAKQADFSSGPNRIVPKVKKREEWNGPIGAASDQMKKMSAEEAEEKKKPGLLRRGAEAIGRGGVMAGGTGLGAIGGALAGHSLGHALDQGPSGNLVRDMSQSTLGGASTGGDLGGVAGAGVGGLLGLLAARKLL